MKMVKDGPIPVIGNVTFIPGSFGWVIDQFLSSDEYRDRAATTKAYARPLLDRIKTKYGAGMLRDLTSKHVKLIRNDIANEFSTSTAKLALGLISTVWIYADERLNVDGLDANPTRESPDCTRARRSMSRGRPTSLRHSTPRRLRLSSLHVCWRTTPVNVAAIWFACGGFNSTARRFRSAR
jgi:hypothetical protein